MMFSLVPAWNVPTVTMTGSLKSTVRATMVWIASTISQATGIGSLVWCGAEPWPPSPTTRTVNSSELPISAPGRLNHVPSG